MGSREGSECVHADPLLHHVLLHEVVLLEQHLLVLLAGRLLLRRVVCRANMALL